MKFSGKVGNGPMNKRLNFGGDPDRMRIATLVRRALAEVCTVPVLLIVIIIIMPADKDRLTCLRKQVPI